MEWMGGSNFLTIEEALRQSGTGELTPAELQRACLHQIDRLNSRLNAFITVGQLPRNDDRAPGTAEPVSTTNALAGIPIAVKDLFDTANVRTTAGSLFFKERVPTTDAAVVSRLKKAGAFIIGKTNTHEIALGVTSANPHFGSCLNPWDESRTPGGSSGGSAVAVATGMALAALGTDTGGSIRIPASLCGVVGLKPTYGRASLRGVFPLSWNLDHAGPLTRSVADAALMLQVIAAYDPNDPGSVDAPVDDFQAHLEEGIAGWRVAVGGGDYVEQADPEVRNALAVGADMMGRLGARVRPMDVSFLHQAAIANGLMT